MISIGYTSNLTKKAKVIKGYFVNEDDVRHKLLDIFPNHDDLLMYADSMTKHCFFLSEYIRETSELVEVPSEIWYRIALVMNAYMGIWGDRTKAGDVLEFPYLPSLDPNTIDARFRTVLLELIKYAKGREII